MATIFEKNYLPNFSEKSLSGVKTELETRQKVRNENFAILNHCIKYINKNTETLPTECREVLLDLCSLVYDIDHEAWHFGRAQMYEYLMLSLPLHLPLIILRVFRTLKVPVTKKKLKEATEFAVFTILKDNLEQGKQQKDIADEYGKNKTFWTRAKKSSYAKRHCKFLKEMNQYKKTKAKTKAKDLTQNEEEGEHDSKQSLLTETDIQYNDKQLSLRSDIEMRKDTLKDRSEDWVVAKKLYLVSGNTSGRKQALEFLEKSGASKKSIKKFKQEILKES